MLQALKNSKQEEKLRHKQNGNNTCPAKYNSEYPLFSFLQDRLLLMSALIMTHILYSSSLRFSFVCRFFHLICCPVCIKLSGGAMVPPLFAAAGSLEFTQLLLCFISQIYRHLDLNRNIMVPLF